MTHCYHRSSSTLLLPIIQYITNRPIKSVRGIIKLIKTFKNVQRCNIIHKSQIYAPIINPSRTLDDLPLPQLVLYSPQIDIQSICNKLAPRHKPYVMDEMFFAWRARMNDTSCNPSLEIEIVEKQGLNFLVLVMLKFPSKQYSATKYNSPKIIGRKLVVNL